MKITIILQIFAQRVISFGLAFLAQSKKENLEESLFFSRFWRQNRQILNPKLPATLIRDDRLVKDTSLW